MKVACVSVRVWLVGMYYFYGMLYIMNQGVVVHV